MKITFLYSYFQSINFFLLQGAPLGRYPPGANQVGVGRRDEWLNFAKEHQKSHEEEMKEFQRNIPRK